MRKIYIVIIVIMINVNNNNDEGVRRGEWIDKKNKSG